MFWTYQFDPGFFEQEILPVLFDIPLSHAKEIRLLQLEDALAKPPTPIAVYYDGHGLIRQYGPAKLDVERVPVWPNRYSRHNAIFHAKNIFLLVEEEVEGRGRNRGTTEIRRALIFGCLSANLTRTGWWENVEVGHFEELPEGEPSRLRDPLLADLNRLLRTVRSGDDGGNGPGHSALLAIRDFVRRLEMRPTRGFGNLLYPQYWAGGQSLVDFLDDAAGGALRDANLEILSPYFDSGEESKPLIDLVERFAPRRVRILLPRDEKGNAQVSAGLYAWVGERPRVEWGCLPADLGRLGSSQDAAPRTVHAKVYRFFGGGSARELIFLGSPNLTSPAHQARGGNWETGFLIETADPGRLEFWLDPEEEDPGEFQPRDDEQDGSATDAGSPLVIRFDWRTRSGSASWLGWTPSPTLRVGWSGGPLFDLGPFGDDAPVALDEQGAAALERILVSTSFLTVGDGSGESAVVLVQEEGMSHKPSLMTQLQLSPADILRYWSLLSPEQRAAFLESRALLLGLGTEDEELTPRVALGQEMESVFGRYARYFHAFTCLERAVRAALESNNAVEADYRLFGQKYDSLGSLLDRVVADPSPPTACEHQPPGASEAAASAAPAASLDAVDRYLIYLCATQLLRELQHEPRFGDYFAARRADLRAIEERLGRTATFRSGLAAASGPDMPAFLEWFEAKFVKRAESLERESR